MDRASIEQALGQPVCAVLPWDPQATDDALLEGRPVAPGSALGRAVADLAAEVFDSEQPASRAAATRGWRSIFSRAG